MEIEPASSWILVEFVTSELGGELPRIILFSFMVFLLLFVCLFVFLGLHLWHIEVPRLGVQLELQLLAYTRATAMQDPSRDSDLHHSQWQAVSLTH